MPSNRRIDPTRTPEVFGLADGFVERFTHAVQALEFEVRIAAGDVRRRDRVGVVGGELRDRTLAAPTA